MAPLAKKLADPCPSVNPALQLSLTRSGHVYPPRGFLAVTAPPSPFSFNAIMSFAEDSIPQTKCPTGCIFLGFPLTSVRTAATTFPNAKCTSSRFWWPPTFLQAWFIFHCFLRRARCLLDVLLIQCPAHFLTAPADLLSLFPSTPYSTTLFCFPRFLFAFSRLIVQGLRFPTYNDTFLLKNTHLLSNVELFLLETLMCFVRSFAAPYVTASRT